MKGLLAGLMLLCAPAHALNRAVMEGIAAGANTIYIDTVNVRVGIGTSSPSQILQIVGPGSVIVSSGANVSTITATGIFGTFTGDGSAITNLSAGSLASGTVPNARLDSSSVTLQGNSFNGANQLLKLDSNHFIPLGSFANVSVPAAAIINGSLGSGVIASSITLAAMYGAPTLTGTNITGLPWAGLTSFPSACSAGQFVSAVGGSLTCAVPSGGAPFDLKTSSNITNGYITSSTQVVTGSATIQGNAFSVGGSSFVVLSGNVGIGSSAPVLDIELKKSNAGGAVVQQIYNTSSAANSQARLDIVTSGTGNPEVTWQGTANSWNAGQDNSDSNKFKLTYGSGGMSASVIALAGSTGGNVSVGTTATTPATLNVYNVSGDSDVVHISSGGFKALELTATGNLTIGGTMSGSLISGGTFGAVNGSALTSLTAANISAGSLGASVIASSHTAPWGITSLTNHGVLLGQGSSNVVAIATAAANFVLTSNGNADPTWQAATGGVTSGSTTTWTGTNNWNGSQTFVSSVTLQNATVLLAAGTTLYANGGAVFLSTATTATTAALSVLAGGAVYFGQSIHNSSSSVMPANQTGTNTSYNGCNISGSTVTITLPASAQVRVLISFPVFSNSSTTGGCTVGVSIDGATLVDVHGGTCYTTGNYNETGFYDTTLAAGSHSFCAGIKAGTNVTWYMNSGTINVQEIR